MRTPEIDDIYLTKNGALLFAVLGIFPAKPVVVFATQAQQTLIVGIEKQPEFSRQMTELIYVGKNDILARNMAQRSAEDLKAGRYEVAGLPAEDQYELYRLLFAKAGGNKNPKSTTQAPGR